MSASLAFAPFSLPAPAKINLFLHIIGRRKDGYHLLQSAMQFIDLADTLHFSPADTTTLEAPSETGPLEKNLLWRAIKALRPFATKNCPFHVRLEKNIPIGGGLGGGSSDAATTLLAVNDLWACNRTLSELQNIGLSLGADIPFFVQGTAAWVEGIGEKLTPHPFFEQILFLAFPNCHSNTHTLYQHPGLTRDTPSSTIGALDLRQARNDFEPCARACYSAIEEAFTILARFAKPQLSGSGACVFVCFHDMAEALEVQKKLYGKLQGRIVRTFNVSPLQAAAIEAKKVFPDWGVAKW